MKKNITLIAAALLFTSLALSGTTFRGALNLLHAPAVTRAEIAGKDGELTVTAPNTIVNKYAKLKSDAPAGSPAITIENPGGPNGLDPASLTAGDLILIIQMAGASIDSSDTPAYGAVTNLNNAGRHEFVTVSSVSGSVLTINPPCGGLRFSYTASGKVQVIRVPQYTNVTINAGASITAPAWNGVTGGIVAMDVDSAATINGAIDVSGLGFRGGALSMAGGGGLRSDYRSTQQDFGAEKGEGIAGYQMDYDAFGGRYGRGAAANGGGGGTSHNSGGGGGANGAASGKTWNGQGIMDGAATGAMAWQLDPAYIANGNALTDAAGGGRGGYSYAVNNGNALTQGPGNAVWSGDGRREVGGWGGRPVPQDPSGRIFLGGGGGAGGQNDDCGGAGGNGGGLIYIRAASVSGTGQLRSNGLNGGNTRNAHRDAPGGGGAGGTIIVAAQTFSNVGAQANGGHGGNQTQPLSPFEPESEGPGGGGGGGFIAVSGGSISAQVNGGLNGLTSAASLAEFPSNGATRGAAGTTSNLLLASIPFCSTTSDLTITKTNNANTIVPGIPVTYSIVAKNNGPRDVYGVDVKDTLPPVFANISWTCAASAGSSCYAPNGTGHVDSKVNLLAGGTATFAVTATPLPGATGTVANTATVAAPPGAVDTNPNNNTDTDTDTLTPQADLGITKSNGVTNVTPGTNTTYTIVVTNNGPSTVPNAAVSDPLSSKFGAASWTCTASLGSACGASSGQGPIATTVTLLPAGSATFTITAAVLPGATGTLENIVTVTPPGTVSDLVPSNNTATDTDTLVAQADLSVLKTLNTNPVVPGTPVKYTIEVSNSGPSAVTGATVNDTLPPQLQNATWTCSATAGSSCGAASGSGNINTTVNLLVNGKATFVLNATVAADATGNIVNTATVTPPAGVPDNNPGNGSSTSTAPVVPASDLTVLKTASPNPVKATENVTFTIAVTNSGPSMADAVSLSDPLAAGLTLVSASSTKGTCSGTQTVTCNIGKLDAAAPNNTAVVTIVAKVSRDYAPGPLSNTAIVGTSTPDPTAGNNSSTAVVSVGPPPMAKFTPAGIAVRTTAVDVCFGGGNVVTYEVRLTNSGDGVQRDNPGAEFTAVLPTQLTALTGSCTASNGACTAGANQIEWNGAIQPGASATITYQVRIRQGTPVGVRFCTDMKMNYDSDNDDLNDTTATSSSCLETNCTPPPCTGPDCPSIGPGLLMPDQVNTAGSDQRPGSILIYPFYTSDSANSNTQNTRISITNIEVTRPAYLHLFFVDGSTCSVADNFLCLTPNQTTSFLISDLDPGVSGYLIAVAVDTKGCPTKFNYLIGDEYVKLSSGHQANLGAEAIAAIDTPECSSASGTATIQFDGLQYNLLGRVVAADNLPSLADGNSTLLVLNRIGGNLAGSATTIGSLFGLLFNDAENAFSFNLTLGACQLRSTLTGSFPRTSPRYTDIVPAGRSGWMKLWLNTTGNEGGLIGATINANSNQNGYRGGHNLHKLTMGSANLTIPIFSPSCQ
jgi:uncharacterized repeat protein (TIGR01451 family)